MSPFCPRKFWTSGLSPGILTLRCVLLMARTFKILRLSPNLQSYFKHLSHYNLESGHTSRRRLNVETAETFSFHLPTIILK
ncbi:hypothetical protein C8R45DRAFT_978551 [Mycena sanguinolenta]|nr:hypothetical protein C8R45DRAFT_978551 [Mycena sanguinolenta]